MRHHQNAHPHRLDLAAAVAIVLLLTTPLTSAAQSSDNASGAQKSAAQTALAIAGATAPNGTGQAAVPVQRAAPKREMTPEERQHFMMLLILHETSRPLGTLH
jgi:hypothetical protein